MITFILAVLALVFLLALLVTLSVLIKANQIISQQDDDIANLEQGKDDLQENYEQDFLQYEETIERFRNDHAMYVVNLNELAEENKMLMDENARYNDIESRHARLHERVVLQQQEIATKDKQIEDCNLRCLPRLQQQTV